jgi:hypothetical protein
MGVSLSDVFISAKMSSRVSASVKPLPVCPFGATCYRKNLLHFATFSHPFNLLDPDADDSDEDEEKPKQSTSEVEKKPDGKKRKATNDEEDAEKTEEYNSDDVSADDCR